MREVGSALRADLAASSQNKGRQLGWHAVPTLPEAEPFPIRQTLTAIRLGQHAVLTLPEAVPILPEAARSARSADPTIS